MNISQNILKWYPFKEDSAVLEIYDETSILENMNKKIQLTTCNINQLNLQGKYDYIILIGTFEYAPLIMEDEKSYAGFLKKLKQHLTSEGIILIAIDNRFGIKYFAGAKSKHYSHVFEGIESKIRKKKANLLLKREIIKFINEAEFKNYKFYYPLPDYKHTNSIFTDEFLPTSNNSKILYPVYYEKGSTVIYNEINIIKQICDMKQFDNFTNSYLVEITNGENLNDIRFVNYNCLRKDKYKLLLIMKNKIVEKIPENENAKQHVVTIKKNNERMAKLGFDVLEKVENGKIISEFIDSEELDKKLVKIVEEDKEKFLLEIENWYEYIGQRLTGETIIEKDIFEQYDINISNEEKQQLKFIKDGYIDLSFENVFCKDGYLLYDQEWYIENVPLEFILYRAINNLYTYNGNKLENIISKEDILEKFNLNNYVNCFEQLEKRIQQNILDETSTQEYKKELSDCYVNIEAKNSTINQLQRQIEELNQTNSVLRQEMKESRIQYINQASQLKDEMEKYQSKLEMLEGKYNGLMEEYNTSYIWKIIKKLRKFRRKA